MLGSTQPKKESKHTNWIDKVRKEYQNILKEIHASWNMQLERDVFREAITKCLPITPDRETIRNEVIDECITVIYEMMTRNSPWGRRLNLKFAKQALEELKSEIK